MIQRYNRPRLIRLAKWVAARESAPEVGEREEREEQEVQECER